MICSGCCPVACSQSLAEQPATLVRVACERQGKGFFWIFLKSQLFCLLVYSLWLAEHKQLMRVPEAVHVHMREFVKPRGGGPLDHLFCGGVVDPLPGHDKIVQAVHAGFEQGFAINILVQQNAAVF